MPLKEWLRKKCPNQPDIHPIWGGGKIRCNAQYGDQEKEVIQFKKGIGMVIDYKFTQNNKSEHTAGPSGPGGPSISIPCESESGKIKKLKKLNIF